jgi:hypothetical protein
MDAVTADNESLATAHSSSLGGWWLRARAEVSSGRWALYAIYIGASVLITQLYGERTDELSTATLAKLVAGEADSPFQYRILMPFLIGIAAAANHIESFLLVDVGFRLLTVFALMLVLRRWMRHFVDPVLADVSPLLLGVMLPWSFHFYWPYDFSGILIWTACLVALVERRYALYLALFAIGTFNRETTFFLMGIFAATQWESLGKRETMKRTGHQLLIWGLIFVGLRVMIRPSGGEVLEFHPLENIAYLTSGVWVEVFEHWTRLLSTLGFVWLLAAWQWRKKSAFLRRACWMLPVQAVVFLVVARLVEIRVWYEWTPIILALAGQGMMELVRREEQESLVEPAG